MRPLTINLIAGTLSYEDVTNVDSTGIITAKSGVVVSGGDLKVGSAFTVGQAGVVTATQFVGDGGKRLVLFLV